MSMDLRQLRYLSTVIQFSNFSTAAKHIHVTQPALTKSIRRLEDYLGVKLLERGATQVRPTIYGSLLNSYAKVVLATVAEAQQEIDSLRGATKGQLRIGAVPSAMNSILSVAIRKFVADRPAVQLSVSEGLNEALLASVTEGLIDIAVIVMPQGQQLESLDDLDYRVLEETEMSIVCHRSHPLAGAERVSLESLRKYDWIVPGRNEPDRRRLDHFFSSAGLPVPNVVAETTSVTMLRAMMEGTEFLSYLTRQSAELREDFAIIPLDTRTWTRKTVAAYRQHSSVRPLVQRFLTALQDVSDNPR